MASMSPFASLLPRPVSTPYPDTIEDQARRDLLEHQGLEFQDRESPYRITLEFDVPTYVAYSNRSDILTFLLNRLVRAVRRGKPHKPSTERDKRTVFFLVTYSLWDLDRVSFRENQTAVLVLERIAHILRSKITYETHMKNALVAAASEDPGCEGLQARSVDQEGGVSVVMYLFVIYIGERSVSSQDSTILRQEESWS